MIGEAARRFSGFPARAALALLLLAGVTYVFAAGGWSAPVTLSTPVPPSYYATTPVIAINSSGAQAAAWINEDNTLLLQVATLDAGGGWTSALTLSSSSDTAGSPAIAIGPGGNAVAIWDSFRSGQGVVIKASARAAHGSWSPVVTLTPTSSSDSATSSQIGMDSNGNAVAIWLLDTGGGTTIQAAYLPAAGSWTTPVNISTPGTTAKRPTLAVNALGDAVAGWETGSGQVLVAERKSGVWGAPISIAPAAYRQNAAQLALGDRGDAALVWSRAGSSFAATRDASGSWSVPVTITTRSVGGSVGVAVDGSGNAVAAFVSTATTSATPVAASSRAAGGSWSSAATISGVSEAALAPKTVATPAGTIVVAWSSSASGGVVAAIRAVGQSKFGAPATVGTGGQVELAAVSGHTAATWLGNGPAVHASGNGTP